jgi:hypothetical protein
MCHHTEELVYVVDDGWMDAQIENPEEILGIGNNLATCISDRNSLLLFFFYNCLRLIDLVVESGPLPTILSPIHVSWVSGLGTGRVYVCPV